jgi:hypothetical protein
MELWEVLKSDFSVLNRIIIHESEPTITGPWMNARIAINSVSDTIAVGYQADGGNTAFGVLDIGTLSSGSASALYYLDIIFDFDPLTTSKPYHGVH